MPDDVRDQIKKAAAAVLGGADPTTIPATVARFEVVERIVREWVERWGAVDREGSPDLVVTRVDQGSLIERSSSAPPLDER